MNGRAGRAFGAAVLVGAVGLTVIGRMVPQADGGRLPSGGQETLRVHLPWVLVALLMGMVAGRIWRSRASLLAAVGAPAVVMAGAAVLGVPGDVAVSVLLVEAAFGATLGWVLARAFDWWAEIVAERGAERVRTGWRYRN